MALPFDFFDGREESNEEKNPRAYAARLASTNFFRVFRGSNSSLEFGVKMCSLHPGMARVFVVGS